MKKETYRKNKAEIRPRINYRRGAIRRIKLKCFLTGAVVSVTLSASPNTYQLSHSLADFRSSATSSSCKLLHSQLLRTTPSQLKWAIKLSSSYQLNDYFRIRALAHKAFQAAAAIQHLKRLRQVILAILKPTNNNWLDLCLAARCQGWSQPLPLPSPIQGLIYRAFECCLYHQTPQLSFLFKCVNYLCVETAHSHKHILDWFLPWWWSWPSLSRLTYVLPLFWKLSE